MRKCKLLLAAILLLSSSVMAATSEVSLEELFGKAGDQLGPFVLHLHCGDGTQTGELLKRQNMVVHGLDTDAGNVEKARRNPAFRKDYGKRLTFRLFDGKHLPFIDNCVNVILSPKSIAVSPGEIHRVLAPGGVAIFRSDETPKISGLLASVEKVKVGPQDGFWRLEKLWPPDIDEWTHHMHGPDNNRVSRDTRLAPPLSHLQWTAGPRYTRHHEHMSSFQAMVSAGGKVFYIIDEGRKDSVLLPPDWNLVARDGFNGIVLWRKKLDHWFNHMWPFKSGPATVTRRLVVEGDRLFAVLGMGGGVSVLDANTGALLHELPGTEGAEEIIVENERLFVAQRQWLVEADKYNVKTKITSGGTAAKMTRNFSWNAAAGRQQVTAFDLAARKRLWQKETPVVPFGLGARNGNVYIFDGERVLSLKADSGQVNWTSPKFSKAKAPFSTSAGCNLVCGEERILLGGAVGKSMVALSAKDGTIVWKAPQYASGRHSPKDLFLIDGKAWSAATLGASMTLPGVPSTAKRKSGRITGYNLNDGKVMADFYTESDVYTTDMVPTFFDVAGAAVPERYRMDGKSIKPLLANPKTKVHDHLYFELGYARGVRTDEWKYIAIRYGAERFEQIENASLKKLPDMLAYQGGAKNASNHLRKRAHYLEPDQLYNLSNDPLEQNNLAKSPEFKAQLEKMRGLLTAKLEAQGRPFGEFVPGKDSVPVEKVQPYLERLKKLRPIKKGFEEITPSPSESEKKIEPSKADRAERREARLQKKKSK